MADFLQITTPITPQNYNFSQKMQPPPTDQIFNLGDTTRILQTTDRSEEFVNQDLKDPGLADRLPKVQVAVSKDPSITLHMLKGLISDEALLSLVSSDAGKEALSKITEFAEEIMLSPEKLPADMIKQDAESTIFSGKLWEALRNILQNSGSEELNKAVMDFVKANAGVISKNETLGSIAANLKYLATTDAASEELAGALNGVADSISPETFGAAKNDILALLGRLNQSFMIDDKTKNFVQLIIYNMSRYNDSKTALNESFASLTHLVDPETAKELKTLFAQYIEESELPISEKQSALIHNDSSAAKHSMTLLTSRLAESFSAGTEFKTEQFISELMGTTDTGLGTESLKSMLNPFIPDNMRGALNTLLRNFENTKDLNVLIDRLSLIINSVSDMDKKLIFAHAINDVLSQLSETEGISYKPPTSMENLCDFLLKNIHDAALMSMSNLDRSEIIQSVLTAPGVFTPLVHLLIPVDFAGIKAFGELWADADPEEVKNEGEGGGNAGYSRNSHIFVCFDVENIGYFELEIYSRNKDLNIMVLCPRGLEQAFAPLKGAIPEIAAKNGYNANNTRVSAMKSRRDLSQVFPKINERRSGFNAKA